MLFRVIEIVSFRIVERRRDDITSARPFAEINDTATLAAKRKRRVGGQNNFSARRTPQARNVFLWHYSLDDARHQIIFVRFGDLAAIELAFPYVFVFAKIVYIHRTVNFRRMHCGTTFPKQVGLG